MSKDILPDCRLRVLHTPKGVIHSPMGNWVPIFCANCGGPGGAVPEENMTFVFYLCNACAEQHGEIAGTMLMPDEVFWEKLKQEQLEAHGRFLTEQEIVDAVESDASPLATLINERR